MGQSRHYKTEKVSPYSRHHVSVQKKKEKKKKKKRLTFVGCICVRLKN